ncbi:MAG: hypothetical protein NTW54_09380 [Bacteroidetes bacterium]|nr:hypothetical protein [Bacteroidota bacterium]
MKNIIIALLVLWFIPLRGQEVYTAEDSVALNSDTASMSTTLGGYGNAYYQRNLNQKYSKVNFERFVLFMGHKFNKKISLFSELEVEDAKISGAEEGGELALEQCYLKFRSSPKAYFVVGLFIPAIGILNETHLPNTYNGIERTEVETNIIPSTWRELGIGYYGKLDRAPISFSLGLMNGLNSAQFEHGFVIRKGRMEGRKAGANNMAVTGALQFYKNNFRAQISGYYGGSVALEATVADTLKLHAGSWGTPVMLAEVDLQHEMKGFSVRFLATFISIPDAASINQAFNNNTPKTACGAYAELAYNIFASMKKQSLKALTFFVRYEILDMNNSIPANGIIDPTLQQQHVISGINYLPVKNVVIKADMHWKNAGARNPLLIYNPVASVYQKNTNFLNLGIGYSF